MSSKLPDYHSHEEYQNRSAKVQELRALGIDPYPHKFEPKDMSEFLHTRYEEEEVGDSEAAGSGTTPEGSIGGRLVLFRAMGKNAFGQIQDQKGRIQVMFNRDLTEVVGYTPKEEGLSHLKLLEKLVDLGDFLGIEGHLFRTGKGELTLFAKRVTLLCKALLPLPDKHAGLSDKELRYRKRWLDLITHSDVAETFAKRSEILRILRAYCHDHRFREVETPILQSVYGGAAAKPFTTELNALDQGMFLRISLEPSLKKLVAGGIDRVFEIGKVFRNEGIDRTHNPEFTMIEAYAAYWDYTNMMEFVEKLLERIALTLYGTTKVPYGDVELDFAAPWRRLSVKDAILEYSGHDVDGLSEEQMRKILHEEGDYDPKESAKASRGLLILLLFEEIVAHRLVQPTHVYDYPLESTPLCKLHRDPAKRAQGVIEQFESYILGHELCNAYSELNDPLFQRELLTLQAARRDAGDEEAMPLDEEFLEAVCQGLPPMGGIGIGIDRLIMLFTNSHSIRDVIYFPLMREEE
jgi:lysyl-tRNA synthetase, class II